LISLNAGAETLGMRAGAEAMMANVGHIEAVYGWLQERTGLAIAEVEELLAALSGASAAV
jgi:hypothetical protein